jgi:septum formation topological specificity factor MinE
MNFHLRLSPLSHLISILTIATLGGSAAAQTAPSSAPHDMGRVTLLDAMVRETAEAPATEPIPEPEQPMQTQFTTADVQVMEELIQIATRNAPMVRDARAEMGVTPFVDAMLVEVAPSWLSSSLSDTSDPALADYRTSDNSTTVTLTFNPLQLIKAIQRQPALASHLRDAKHQTRVAVIQNYVAYVQARQSASIAQRRLDTVVATIVANSRIASADLTQVAAGTALVNHEEYVAAATESLTTNGDEMMALEMLAASVGLPSHEMLDVMQQVMAAETDRTEDSANPSEESSVVSENVP